MDHVGLTVPDLEQAIDFFTAAFNAEVLFHHGGYQPRAQVNRENFNRPEHVSIVGIAMIQMPQFRLELLQYRGAATDARFPITHEPGGHHLSLYAPDMDVAMARIELAGGRVLGSPMSMSGPEAGDGNQFVYCQTPWGLAIELVHYPHGKAYEQA